jgi:amino acid permease
LVPHTGKNIWAKILDLRWPRTRVRHQPYSAGGFLNGFKGFCSVFVTASFAFSGTELTGLAAAEAANPKKEIPKATKQVVWRICIFYIVNLFLVGLIVPANSPLFNAPGAESRRSPFVIAIELAGIKALPSIFNAMILISVMSVANSCTFGSTRTFQALAANGKPSTPGQNSTTDLSEQAWAQRSFHMLTERVVPSPSSSFNFSLAA